MATCESAWHSYMSIVKLKSNGLKYSLPHMVPCKLNTKFFLACKLQDPDGSLNFHGF
uniref:Uncharacterized protein n=1 Tax=Arundo donax TaxID=35708 RepID=A0A0A9AH16_ARUDO